MPFWSDSEHTISIHALREEGDREFVNFCAEQLDFYPRPPRGGRPEKYRDTQAIIEFLSTPSARRATRGVQRGQQQQGDFYPRPPRGGRPSQSSSVSLVLYFYPRPPRGGRRKANRSRRERKTFLSTPSARRATNYALRLCRRVRYFYPRPPRGGRLPRPTIRTQAVAFLSTPSARRATLPSCWKITRRQNFYPRPPRGGRHQQGLEKMWSRKFLSTPSARRATHSI